MALCARPAGRPAGYRKHTGLEAKAIHRLLEAGPRTGGFRRNAANPLICKLSVVDESSVADVLLMRSLLRALPDVPALLMVGAVDQLPSVGPGQVLADMIGSEAVPVVRLMEVFRRAAQSRVIINAHRINRRQMSELEQAGPRSDFYV